jgi:tetratricopeptide (TPR) repeat protein
VSLTSFDARAMAVFLDGDIGTAVDAFDRVAQLFVDSGNLLRVVTPRSTRGHALVVAGRPREGLADTEAALDLSRSLGYPEGEAMVLWQNSEALTALGRTAEAKHAAANAVSIAERVGRRGWTATALRSIGIAYEATGDLPTAEDAFRRFAPQEPASAAVFVLGTCATCPRTGGHGEARGGRHSCRSRACHGATSRPVRSTGRQMRARRRPSATEHLRDAPGCGAPRDRGRPSGQPGPSLHVDRFLGGGLEHSH